jgi:catechol 2,3-dioxygenase-like lactoylglutathione lyase family enzyme
MQFAYTIVYVADVAASLSFFEQAFGLQRRFLHESGAYGELDTGATALAFVDHATARDSVGHDYVVAATSAAPLGIEIGLATDDVAAAFEKAVQAGATALAAPVTKPWGQTVAYVRCPDGTLVELCTPMG